VHDRDSAFHAWTTTAAALGIQEVVTAPAQPTCCSGRVRSRRLRCPRLAPPRQSFRPAVQQRKLPRRSIRRNRWSLCHRCRSWYRARHRSCSAPARSRCRRFCRHVIFTLPHALLETKTSAAVCAPRKGIVEPVTGQIKQARSFRQFLLRWLRAGPRGMVAGVHDAQHSQAVSSLRLRRRPSSRSGTRLTRARPSPRAATAVVGPQHEAATEYPTRRRSGRVANGNHGTSSKKGEKGRSFYVARIKRPNRLLRRPVIRFVDGGSRRNHSRDRLRACRGQYRFCSRDRPID
jgi:hypothetical protein